MITAGLIKLSAALLWVIGQIDGSDVTQSPLLWGDEGQSATINCSHTKDVSFFEMYWYRQLPGEGMKQIVLTTTTPPHKYESGFSEDKFPATKNDAQTGSLTVEKLLPEDSAVYFCAVSKHSDTAYFGQGTKLTVLEPNREVTPPTVKVLRPSPKECRNKKDERRKKTIVCVASGFYPDHVSVSWEIDGRKHSDEVATDSAALLDGGYYKITSRLRVPAETWYQPSPAQPKTFTCIVSFFNRTHDEIHKESILGEEAKASRSITRETFLRVTQGAKLSYCVFIVKSCIYGAFVAFLVWKLQGSNGKRNN
ncbi:immunoglobulin lambda-1 light chain-like [Enoplosus armatus]|uniref:immunoglobulin lambda-1 light chain-like n=1 Tax=Enoplosus armatus TaxID=215367 RepID=UPI003996A30B